MNHDLPAETIIFSLSLMPVLIYLISMSIIKWREYNSLYRQDIKSIAYQIQNGHDILYMVGDSGDHYVLGEKTGAAIRAMDSEGRLILDT